MKTKNVEKPDPSTEESRDYKPPRMKVLGSIRELTQAKGGTKNDGQGKPRSKTNGAPG